ncbi:MAG: hypothetical protein Q9195_005644 [Heterodermia aff. obscurata]
MGILSPSFLLGAVVCLYLLSFVAFAILRIATGISIQRIGFTSLRRIAYTSRDGVRLDIRGFGLSVHKPTFAQPTWLSLRFTELKITIDAQALIARRHQKSAQHGIISGNPANGTAHAPPSSSKTSGSSEAGDSRSRTWKRLTQIKEEIKKLHEKIHWLSMVDVVATDTSLVMVDVGTFQVGTLQMAVDTRRKTVDRGQLFRHKRVPQGDKRPAEWRFSVKSVLFTPVGKEPLEVIDILALNIHGLLYKDRAGLRDASISLKLGRVHIPYDDLVKCHSYMQKCWTSKDEMNTGSRDKDISISDVIEELDRPGSREANIVQTVSDSKEFISSILGGIQEIQIAVSFVGLTKDIRSLRRTGAPLYLDVAMNEIGIDMHRLDPKSPAHRMYFSSKDVAHQALIAAISIALSLSDGGDERPERVLYVPMATTTVKTTLPSKTVAVSEDKDAAERNANILFANLVVTSPSIDVDPRHMPLLLAMIRTRKSAASGSSPFATRGHHLIRRLLPKANIKFSIHEPVLRVTLPPADPALRDTDEYDLLISTVSSISLNVESSHSSAGELHYALVSDLRILSHQLYYQNAAGERHNLLLADTVEFKVQVSASPEVSLSAFANFQTFSIHMVRPELRDGLRQIVQQLGRQSEPTASTSQISSRKPNVLRSLPTWLAHCQLRGSNFGVEVAGIDPEISKSTRGVSLQLESWTAEYKAHRTEDLERPPSRRRRPSKSLVPDVASIQSPSTVEKVDPSTNTNDGRRLAIHLKDFEGFVIEGPDVLEPEPFIAMPRFEVAFTTSSDNRGQVFHINSHIKALYVQYSLYRYYAIMIATMVIRKVAAYEVHTASTSENVPSHSHAYGDKQAGPLEVVTTDLKIELFQLKATLPSDPPMMLQLFGMEAGQHRWAVPFTKCRLLRAYVETPSIRKTWARIMSLKTFRIDLREIRRRHGKTLIDEKCVDLSADFIRLAVPHQLVLHSVFDNFANVLKATEQMHHRFKTRTNEYILKKRPQQPKKVPRISIRSKAFLFDIEDGAFEWKLGCIYRTGLIEQKQRLARDEAYNTKVKNIDNAKHRRETSRPRDRSRSAHQPRRGKNRRSYKEDLKQRSSSSEAAPRGRSRSDLDAGMGRMRYDPKGECGMTGPATVANQEAWRRLQLHNAQSWKKRIDRTYGMQNAGIRAIRGMFWGHQDPGIDEGDENILAMNDRPGLMSAMISDLHIILDKPSFPLLQYPHFLHRVGKGMPLDMEYTLVIPLSIQIDMGEARMTLRDYPLPLIHVPAIRPGQSPRLPSWSLKTDFVIAEEYRGDVSTKEVKVEVVPPGKLGDSDAKKGFAIDVRRTVSPVKTYSDVQIAINSSAPTSITWGSSYQPAIQDMMMVIEGFSKPQVDPSDRVGFWDKIRLSCHSRVNVAWKGDADVLLKLKGTRDPYVVTGHGAGFVMCWRNNVHWGIHADDDPKKFMCVTSGEYVLAIPDYSHQARETSSGMGHDTDSVSSKSSNRDGSKFKKVVMKLSGNVRWLAGLVLERNVPGGGRSFEFAPHYDVVLTTPDRAKASPGQVSIIAKRGFNANNLHQMYDAFDGFRSNHIHLSLAVTAPLDRDWTVNNTTPSTSYNAVHMTPRFFTHFFDWWSMFSGVMSLPIRQGKLFPGVEKSSKKFGRHLATFKYNLLLSPLFITHMYIHKDAEDYVEETVSATGLKLRLDSFMLDLHQRREEFAAQGKAPGKQMRTSGMRINEAQLDFITADLRAVSASIAGPSSEDVERASESDLASYQQPGFTADMSRFTIPDNDFSWVDMDDFVELDWILPSQSNPQTKIMPLAFAPRFTYFRQTDHRDSISGDIQRKSPFGNEPTHYCVMSQDNDPRKVQCSLIEERVARINEQLAVHGRTLGEQELRVVRDGNRDGSLKERYEILQEQGQILQGKKEFLQGMLRRLKSRISQNDTWDSGMGSVENDADDSDDPDEHDDPETRGIEASPLVGSVSEFNNRFIVHNSQIKWNNSLRNIILRYVHQVSQRRGFIYYMTRRAVKFILDIVEEQNKSKISPVDRSESGATTPTSQHSPVAASKESNGEVTVQDRIHELLRDTQRIVDANDPDMSNYATPQRSNTANIEKDISVEFTPMNSYHVKLIAPQIQLQSEKNPKSVLLVTAKGMQLKVIQVMDKDRMADDVSGLVQRRFSVDMDSVQFFVSTQKNLMQFLNLHSGNRYGTPKGSAWPPWVPFEVNFDFDLNPFGFSRVVQKTSASLRYDKYNTLRLKYNDEVNSGTSRSGHAPENPESRIDHLWVDFPHIRAICDSAQYYTMYVIVLDLLLYSEPLEKVRSERLEKIMLASDFSDLRGAPEMVIRLQERIRQLEEIKSYFAIHAKFLDRQGWQDRLSVEQDLTSCEDELFFMMKAITTSQRKNEDRTQTSQTTGLLRWYLTASEMVWHLIRDKNEPLMEIQLQGALYDRTDNSDGSNHNTMEIQRVHGVNLLPQALYPEMLAPYTDNAKKIGDDQEEKKMLQVHWHMLEAIAGIPVLDQFEVNLHPLRVQLEREIGKKLFEYIFPGVGTGKEKDGSFSPFLVKNMNPVEDEDEDSDVETQHSISDVTGHGTTGSSDEQQTRSGSLEMRLRPTNGFSHGSNHRLSRPDRQKPGVIHSKGDTHHFRLFQHSDRSHSASRLPMSRKSSRESVSALGRTSHDASSSSLSALNGGPEKPKRFKLHRSSSQADSADKDKPSDDLTMMMSRASNYMTLAYVKVPSVVLCLSYKGRGERNIEDVHNFVFRMPDLEYRNKTWSNLDLALRLKKDVIRALISHTGAIIGNKFSKHRPNKNQLIRLREHAHSSTILPNASSLLNVTSNGRHLRGPFGESPRTSSGSTISQLPRSDSYASSMGSSMAPSRDRSRPPSIHEVEDESKEAPSPPSSMRRSNFIRRFTSESPGKKEKETNGEEAEDG